MSSTKAEMSEIKFTKFLVSTGEGDLCTPGVKRVNYFDIQCITGYVNSKPIVHNA